VRLTVLRPNPQNNKENDPTILQEVSWDENPQWFFDEAVPLSLSSPMAIQPLGLAYHVKTTVEDVDPAFKNGKLKKGDVIRAIRFRQAGDTKEDSSWGSWLDLKSHQWARVFFALQHLQDYRRIELKVEREGETEEIELTTQPDRQWPLYDRGFMFMPD